VGGHFTPADNENCGVSALVNESFVKSILSRTTKIRSTSISGSMCQKMRAPTGL